MTSTMTPFQKIPDACKTTGLSQYYLRNGCKDGSIPHVKSGTTYLMVNTKVKRSEVDRFTGHAITNVGKNTPAQQKAVDEINAMFRNNKNKKSATKKKK